jgi:hypothetical protein
MALLLELGGCGRVQQLWEPGEMYESGQGSIQNTGQKGGETPKAEADYWAWGMRLDFKESKEMG